MKCPICKIRQADSPHHIIPKAEGGNDGRRNKIPVCRICHDELEALADRGIPCTPAIIKLMQLGEYPLEPKINTIEDINSMLNTNAIKPIKWIPIDELLASLPKKIHKKGGRPRLPDGAPMSRYTIWRRKKEAQGICPTCGAQIMTKGRKGK